MAVEIVLAELVPAVVLALGAERVFDKSVVNGATGEVGFSFTGREM